MHGLLDKLDINNDVNLQKDLEKILVDDLEYPEVVTKLKTLKGSTND